jgi:di/tricarboxylate transporter
VTEAIPIPATSLLPVVLFPVTGVVDIAVATVVVFLTEVTPNTATATVFMPIMLSLGLTLGVPPLTLMAAVSLAASMAFMLPVATPPNAVVFGSGYVTIPQMSTTGLWLNLLDILAIVALAYLWLPIAPGIAGQYRRCPATVYKAPPGYPIPNLPVILTGGRTA